MIKVIVAESNDILRQGIQAALTPAPLFQIVAEAISKEQLLACYQVVRHDVLLIGAEFLRKVSVETLEDHADYRPLASIVVFSHVSDPTQGVIALRKGVCGYLTSRCSPRELRDALAHAARGKRYIDAALADEMVRFLETCPSALPYLLLSARELQIYKMLALGLTVARIAVQLGLSLTIVKICQARLAKKLAMDGLAGFLQHTMADAAPRWRPTPASLQRHPDLS